MGIPGRTSTSRKVSQPRLEHGSKTANSSIKVRTTRSRIIYLRNDYKELMEAIEKQIHEHFASLPEEVSERTEQQTPTPQEPLRDYVAPPGLTAPFAKVNTVVDGSPASLAGLKPGDQIRNFGYVNSSNHDDLKKVAECVQGNEGVRELSHLRRGCLLTCLPQGNGTGQGVPHRGRECPGASVVADAEA